jgi:hypothetical protein
MTATQVENPTTGTTGSAQLALTPAALEALWKRLWFAWQCREEDTDHAYDDDARYRSKVAAGAACFSLCLLHDPLAPGAGACRADCDHLANGLSPENTAKVLADIDQHLARTEEKSRCPNIGADGRLEHAELLWLRAEIVKAASQP